MSPIERLVAIMARLRDPNGGCPWDLEQDFASIAPYTLEEAYEVDDAIRRGDMAALLDELGDLLLQVVFHARMAEEAGHFRFDDVVAAICDKLVRRHPHVFGEAEIRTSEEQTRSWEAIKAAEREEAGAPVHPLDDVPVALPALSRAARDTSLRARISAGSASGTPSIALCSPFAARSAALWRSHASVCACAVSTRASPNTWGCRAISFSHTASTTSPKSKWPASRAIWAWNTTWSSRSPSSSRSPARSLRRIASSTS